MPFFLCSAFDNKGNKSAYSSRPSVSVGRLYESFPGAYQTIFENWSWSFYPIEEKNCMH